MNVKKYPKRVTIRLTEENYGRLSDMRELMGFNSNYEFVRHIITFFLQLTESEKREPKPETVEDEIRDMFSEYSDYEEPEYVKPVRSKSKKCH